MGNHDYGATAVNVMAILQFIDYNKFERFSNVANEISAKLHSSFLDCQVLVVIPDRYGFEFLLKMLKENTGQKTQLIYRN